MATEQPSLPGRVAAEEGLQEFGHPRGTLVIVIIFGVLFGLAWLAMYFYSFLERGAPHA